MLLHKIYLAGLLACNLLIQPAPASAISHTIPVDKEVLVGSTPGDALIKSLLSIAPGTEVDFIRWELVLEKGNTTNAFRLNIHYGVSQPNTLGFINGGKTVSFEGVYTVTVYPAYKMNLDMYQLKSKGLPTGISLVKLAENIFHLLTPARELMVGNGGWNYVLARKEPLVNAAAGLPSFVAAETLLKDTATTLTFTGRTPCREFSKEYNYQVTDACFKLKWKLVLHKDRNTLQPTTYALYWTQHRRSVVEGKWKIIKGAGKNPDAVRYQLDPDKPAQSFSFLAADRNILYFLDRKNQLFPGNKDFSYALNKTPN